MRSLASGSSHVTTTGSTPWRELSNSAMPRACVWSAANTRPPRLEVAAHSSELFVGFVEDRGQPVALEGQRGAQALVRQRLVELVVECGLEDLAFEVPTPSARRGGGSRPAGRRRRRWPRHSRR